jgi:RHS repeat-associated protein
MIKGGITYRIVADQLGSVRLVVRSTDGVVVQRIDYDEFGRVTQNTAPGFQPFGFAGGLYDEQTGFVRFGRRDYDALVGRWTAKDPVMFWFGRQESSLALGRRGISFSVAPFGVDGNLYAYVSSDPINFVDPLGLWSYATEKGTTGNGLNPVRILFGVEGTADAVFQQLAGRDAVVTFGTNGTHGDGSLHYPGFAVDLRTRDLSADQRREATDLLRERLGDNYDVVDEGNHIHVEWDPCPARKPSRRH